LFTQHVRSPTKILFRLPSITYPTFAPQILHMFWTLELSKYLIDAPWPSTKDELLDYAIRSGAPLQVVENLQELESDDENYVYESMEEIWPDYPTKEDYLFNEDEY